MQAEYKATGQDGKGRGEQWISFVVEEEIKSTAEIGTQ